MIVSACCITFGGMLRLRAPTSRRGWRGFCQSGALVDYLFDYSTLPPPTTIYCEC